LAKRKKGVRCFEALPMLRRTPIVEGDHAAFRYFLTSKTKSTSCLKK